MLEMFRGLFVPKKEKGMELEKKELPRFFGTVESRQGDNHEDNEDSSICDHEHQLYGVFDGVSGELGGKLASEKAREVFEKNFSSLPFEYDEEKAKQLLLDTIQQAHAEIRNIKVENQDHAPGTTVSVLKFFRNPKTKKVYGIIGNIGDSRIYHFSKDRFRRITLDHNLQYQQDMDQRNYKGPILNTSSFDSQSSGVYDLLDTWGGEDYSTPDGTNVYVQSGKRNIITSGLGGKSSRPNYIDIVTVKDIFPGDRFVLTSDGIHDNLTTSEIKKAIEDVDDSMFVPKSLVEAAYQRSLQTDDDSPEKNHRAKSDDMTAVCVRVESTAKAATQIQTSIRPAA